MVQSFTGIVNTEQEMSIQGEDSKFSFGHAGIVWAVSGALNGDVQGS